MLNTSATATATENDNGYPELETLVRERIAAATGPFFTADADPDILWQAYLDGLPAERRQHYNCHACRRFVQRFGGLVRDSGEPVCWPPDAPAFFVNAVAGIRRVVLSARTNGVFLFPSTESTWGTPTAGGWSHLAGTVSPDAAKRWSLPDRQACSERMAEKKQDFEILSRGLAEYKIDAVRQAVRLLKSEALYRSEKAEGIGDWLLALHESLDGARDQRIRRRIMWSAVAEAPPGFCHITSTIISTLLDDINAGLPIETIKSRWASKLHPLQYQRPTAAPTNGAIEAAEKFVQDNGFASAFERRFATLDDVQAFVWRRAAAEAEAPRGDSLFGHLKQNVGAATQEYEIPEQAVTWEKFARTALPGALEIEVNAPGAGAYYGLTTAAHDDAKPILQWDGLDGHPQNAVAHYFYTNGSRAVDWGLTPGWVKVAAIFLHPSRWQEPEKFSHHGDRAFFAIEGARDTRSSRAGLAIFPENLKSELHAIRKVVEAHSSRGEISGNADGNANGIAFQAGAGAALQVRVRGAAGWARYRIDRWD